MLRDPNVRRANFGRVLSGRPDRLLGFTVTLLKISDPDVVAMSGQTHHPIVAPSSDPADGVEGAAFEVTEEELAKADDYEIDDYHRILAPLASGDSAWAYVSRQRSARAGG